jgi:hypothetical protein
MKSLSNNWITENRIDFEYKKYVLLAYLQEVKKCFDEKKLYPPLSEIVTHYENVVRFKETRMNFIQQLPKLLNGIDMANKALHYELMLENDMILAEIENIIEFSIPLFLRHLEQGKDIFDFVEKAINIEPIGLVPLQNKFGYLLIKANNTNDTRVYEYHISTIEQPNERLSSLKTSFLKSYENSLSHTFQYIKTDILHQNKVYSNPAVFGIESEINFPFDETILPVAKRLFLKMIHPA